MSHDEKCVNDEKRLNCAEKEERMVEEEDWGMEEMKESKEERKFYQLVIRPVGIG